MLKYLRHDINAPWFTTFALLLQVMLGAVHVTAMTAGSSENGFITICSESGNKKLAVDADGLPFADPTAQQKNDDSALCQAYCSVFSQTNQLAILSPPSIITLIDQPKPPAFALTFNTLSARLQDSANSRAPPSMG